MEYIPKDPACHVGETALGDLLDLVEGGLLVVKLPSRGGSVPSENLPHHVRTEMSSDLVFPDRTSLPQDSPSQARFEGIRMIKIPQPESILKEPVRYRADELWNSLKRIESRHAEGSYRFITPRLPPPGATLTHCSMPISHGGNKQQPKPRGDYNVQTEANTRIHQGSTVRLDKDQLEAFLEDHARGIKDDDVEAHFTTKGRPKGSTNKRTVQTTKNSTKTSDSTSSSSRPSNSKRPRIDRDDDDGQGEREDGNQCLQRRDCKSSLSCHNLACPFEKYLPLEYPQCRASQFRNISDVK